MLVNQNELIYADKVYIDTSTLMDIQGMEMFIESYRDILNKTKTMIIISPSVTQELIRHLESEEKHEMARHALDLIRVNNDIFKVENAGFSCEDIRKAFADESLYKILLSQRDNCRQLLITNDRKLSRDAFRLNNLESWSGRTVAVCYIDHYGRLEPCECVEEEYRIYNLDSVGLAAAADAQAHPEKFEVKPKPMEPEKDDWKKYVLGAAVGIGLFTAGFFTGKIRLNS